MSVPGALAWRGLGDPPADCPCGGDASRCCVHSYTWPLCAVAREEERRRRDTERRHRDTRAPWTRRDADLDAPTARTHEVIAEIPLPADLRAVVKVMDGLAALHEDAVAVSRGPLWKPGVLVIAIPRSTPP